MKKCTGRGFSGGFFIRLAHREVDTVGELDAECTAPPANAFWSLTMHDADRYLVENPIHRYAIRDRTPGVRYNSDGSLDIYISRTAPYVNESNWLPAASGELSLALRLYLPQPKALDGS